MILFLSVGGEAGYSYALMLMMLLNANIMISFLLISRSCYRLKNNIRTFKDRKADSLPGSVGFFNSCLLQYFLFLSTPSSSFPSSVTHMSDWPLRLPLLHLFVPCSLLSCSLCDVASGADITLLSINTPSRLSQSNRGSLAFCSHPHFIYSSFCCFSQKDFSRPVSSSRMYSRRKALHIKVGPVGVS